MKFLLGKKAVQQILLDYILGLWALWTSVGILEQQNSLKFSIRHTNLKII